MSESKRKVLCVNIKNLPVNKEVIKDFDYHTVFNDTVFMKESEVYGGDYLPLLCATAIRTVFSNKVIVFPHGNVFQPRNIVSGIPVYEISEKSADDIIQYVGAFSMNDCFKIENLDNYDSALRKAIMMCQFQTLGIYNPAPDFCYPMVVSNVIIKDDCLPVFEYNIKDGVEITNINNLTKENGAESLLSQLVIVKGE